jgi:predicted glycosyltransferase
MTSLRGTHADFNFSQMSSAAKASFVGKKIWIDLDNTPHVPFFKPIIRELEMLGFTVILTARDAFQVCELATRFGLVYKKVGRHYGKNSVLKIGGLIWRTLQLLPLILRERPVMGLSHGSRSQILLCNLLRIPTVMIMDYEHAQMPWLLRPRWEIVPAALFNESLQCKTTERIRKYNGIKEDVYAPEFVPDSSLRRQFHLSEDDVIVTVRPPANEAHYHNPESDRFFVKFMEKAFLSPGVKVVLLPRNKNQAAALKINWPEWFADSKVIIPNEAVDGLNLLWHSDLVVSGGGTMNREAAALGIPVYSIFRGKSGAVDRHLQRHGKMTLIESIEDVENKIILKHREKEVLRGSEPRSALSEIVQQIGEIINFECRS